MMMAPNLSPEQRTETLNTGPNTRATIVAGKFVTRYVNKSPIPGLVGGIPGDLFVPGRSGDINTGPRRVLHYNTEKPHLLKFSYGTKGRGKDVHFLASVLPHDDGLPIFGFSTKSKLPGRPDMRHPDLRPGLLIGAALVYFENLIEQPIAHMRGLWVAGEGSDNFAQFSGALQQFGEGPYSDEQKATAAQSTWTGHQAERYGFTEVTSVYEDPMAVVTVFSRPPSN